MTEALLPSLLLTVLLELPFAWLWGARKQDLLPVFLMNVLTNPLVVIWYYSTWQAGWLISTALPELAAMAAETLILAKFAKHTPHPVALGIFINLFSYSAGVICNYLVL